MDISAVRFGIIRLTPGEPDFLRCFEKAPTSQVKAPPRLKRGYAPIMGLVTSSMSLKSKLGLLKKIDPEIINFAFTCKAEGPDKGKSVLDFQCVIKEPDLVFGLMECLSRKKNPSDAEIDLIFRPDPQYRHADEYEYRNSWPILNRFIQTGDTREVPFLFEYRCKDSDVTKFSFNRIATVLLKAPLLKHYLKGDAQDTCNWANLLNHPVAGLWNPYCVKNMSPQVFRLFVQHPYFEKLWEFHTDGLKSPHAPIHSHRNEKYLRVASDNIKKCYALFLDDGSMYDDKERLKKLLDLITTRRKELGC